MPKPMIKQIDEAVEETEKIPGYQNSNYYMTALASLRFTKWAMKEYTSKTPAYVLFDKLTELFGDQNAKT